VLYNFYCVSNIVEPGFIKINDLLNNICKLIFISTTYYFFFAFNQRLSDGRKLTLRQKNLSPIFKCKYFPEICFHINQHPDIYRIKNIEAPASICRPDLHLEVDTDEDFALVAHIYEHFAANPLFTIEDVVAYTDANPPLLEANSVVERRWKQYRQDS
jgi:hypothetical protein